MKIGFIRDNNDTKTDVILELKVEQELRAIKDESFLDDIGMSGLTASYKGLIKGNIYKVNKLIRWDFETVAYVRDEDGDNVLATPERFELVECDLCSICGDEYRGNCSICRQETA